jgi:peptide/nickel transport system permease protein
VISLPLSVLTALKKDTALDHIIRFFSFIANSLPNFLISVLLMYWLCVKARLLPVVADSSLKGLLLPSLALSIPMIGRFLRQFRAEVLEQLGQSYVSGAVSRGVKRRYILYRNVLHNASITILTVVGLQIGTLFGGSVVIETIFRWPGLGKMAMDAITNRDYPVIQGFVLFTSVVYVMVNLLTDIAYHWVDPRVRPE